MVTSWSMLVFNNPVENHLLYLIAHGNIRHMTEQKDVEHVHTFKLQEKKVLLSKYSSRRKYLHTSGYDIIKQRVCECGLVEAYDLERTKA